MTSLNQHQIIEKLEANRDKISQFGINKIGLYGSYVRDQQSPNSDIDIIVSFSPDKRKAKNYFQFLDFSEKMFGKQVDLITFEAAQHRLLKYIQNEIKYAQI